MQFADLAELVRARRSIRKYRPDEVPDELLVRAIDLATWAPNGGNRQPWQFWVVKNRDVIGRMADAVDARSRLMASWPEADAYREDADRWVRVGAFFRNAPACIAVMVGGYESLTDKLLKARGADDDPSAREMAEWRRFGSSRMQTIGAAVQNLLLALYQQGLGACWMAGPQQAKGEIEAILGVQEGWEFVALIPVGWPAEEKAGAPRKPLDEVITWVR
ncbi:MAG TPA: nitroreductase family protein [Symbiobacteriaceae bacterium]|nr:nitroreductase family protein [Symbiobacteriaceae bacterium]